MRSQIEMNDRFKTQALRAADPESNDGPKIEEILRRAQEIHREHGGVLGYDSEDWLQAWGELQQRGSRRELVLMEANGAGSMLAHVSRLGDSSSSI
jgi:hypothetical protein